MQLKQDKIKEFLSGKKNIGMIYVIVIIGVLLICMGNIFSPNSVPETQEETYPDTNLESDIEKILTEINGVGQVKVLVTYKTGYISFIAKDVNEKTTKDIDSNSKEKEEKNVLIGSGASQKPYIIKKEMPQVQGVVVVAKGGGDPGVKREIIQAVKALCGIGTNNIKVFEKR